MGVDQIAGSIAGAAEATDPMQPYHLNPLASRRPLHTGPVAVVARDRALPLPPGIAATGIRVLLRTSLNVVKN